LNDRSPDQTAVSISLPRDLLAQIDARAKALRMPRSRYLGMVAYQELTKGGPLMIPGPENTQPPATLDLTAEVYDFLLMAIPALEKYAAVVEGHDQDADPPMSFDPPDDPALSKLWRFFLHEMDEILRHKYLRSKELGYDMGLSAAITEWLQKHRALWAAAHPPTAD